MALNIWALTIVKALGLGYPAVQIVFLRAIVGLAIILPWAMYARASFTNLDRYPLHILRVLFSALALTAGFFAIARLPFALVTTISFIRPVLTMIMAVIFLNEVVGRGRWIAAGFAFLGVVIALEPRAVTGSWALGAMGLAVLFGTSAIIVTRILAHTPTVVMMTFYTGGLAILTAPFAVSQWAVIPVDHLAPLLAIGVFSQCAQFCFLRAHRQAEAAFLSILGYLSLVLTTSVGYIFFEEIPSMALLSGAVIIMCAAVATTATSRPKVS